MASNSPRRRELLALSCCAFHVRPVDVDETPLPGESPAGYVERLARHKGRTALVQAGPGESVVAADTTVADGGRILGKPRHAAEAQAMLRQLRGRNHQVYTAVAVLNAAGLEIAVVCATQVPMRAYSDAEIEAYIATGDPFDKAGAYAIQHRGFDPVIGLTGCYANVMGLPLCHLSRLLRQAALDGVLSGEALARTCQAALAYDCPVYHSILEAI